ncbi:MAG: cysteine--tRNA ligase [Actinobacteria bacterium]|nr:cysteine--tRNA ligase [Actinomycetota bacterium]
MRIYDTLSRDLKEVNTTSSTVSMYCCGPTVYRDVHVGNLRTFLLSDLIRRTLELNGNSVRLIQNITDVGHLSEDFHEEDKMLAQSRLENRDPFSVARHYEAGFHSDLKDLNIIPADLYPRASDCIALMQDLINRLIAGGFAYCGSDGSVYFDATSFPSYGALSGNRLDALKPGHRYEYAGEGAKKFHADWALWKSAGMRTEMIWDSPWGAGFPGWHVECSAMSLHFLDAHINVHVGGMDLRFPHHENERAQSNAVAGEECVDLWVHGEHLLFEGRKMSKSAGNVLRLSDITNRGFDPLAIRLAFLENRYRSQMDLSWDAIAAAHSTLIRWRKLVRSVPVLSLKVHNGLLQAFNEDLDTPKAIQILRAIEKDSKESNVAKVESLLYADKVLGLDLSRAETETQLTDEVKDLLAQRADARAKGKWDESDRIRELLESFGLSLQDGPAGQSWSFDASKRS